MAHAHVSSTIEQADVGRRKTPYAMAIVCVCVCVCCDCACLDVGVGESCFHACNYVNVCVSAQGQKIHAFRKYVACCTLRKLASMLHAIARASSVLPVPGGPYRSTPVHVCVCVCVCVRVCVCKKRLARA